MTNFIALHQPMPEISLTKYLADEVTKSKRYIPKHAYWHVGIMINTKIYRQYPHTKLQWDRVAC